MLRTEKGKKSIVRNLNVTLSAFVDMGTIEGDFEEENGCKVVKISPDKLTELWYSGSIGGEIEHPKK